MTTAAVFGSTGFVGAEILASVLGSESYTSVHTISRRQPAGQGNPKLHTEVEAETSKWPEQLSAIKPVPDVVYSGVGTTRAAAGGIANQWKIDHDLNVELAQAAKKAGVKTFVFISSAGTRSALASRAPYSQMKNGVEDAIMECDFEQAIILKPGLIMGARKPEEEKFGGPLMNTLVNGLGRFSPAWKDSMGQDRREIGRAAVEAAKVAAEGKAPSKYWVLEGKDILKLGRVDGLGEEGKAAAPAESKEPSVVTA